MFKNQLAIFRYLLPVVIVFIAQLSWAFDDDENIEQLPEELSPAFEHLLSHPQNNSPEMPNAEQINKVISYVAGTKNMENTLSMGQRKGASSSYCEFSVNSSLKGLMDLVYNPDIPGYLTAPAAIRRSEWIQIDGKQQPLPKLSTYLDQLSSPVIIKGVEFIENAPDTFSGAYYAYELNRALILTRYEGHNVLISISCQRKKSGVGKKGLVLGDKDNWDYLYTGEKGCTKRGLGWIKTYMYDSASIMVYYEENGPNPRVRIGAFKWLRAGWAGMNMVQPHHICKGVHRFANTYKEVLESPNLKDTNQIGEALRQIANLSDQEMRQKVQLYYSRLKTIYQDRLPRKGCKLLENGSYLSGLSRKEMKAILEKAYFKHLLGKSTGIDISFLGSPKAKRPS